MLHLKGVPCLIAESFDSPWVERLPRTEHRDLEERTRTRVALSQRVPTRLQNEMDMIGASNQKAVTWPPRVRLQG